MELKKDEYAFNAKLVMEDEDTLKIVQNYNQVIEEVYAVLIPTKEHSSPECIATKKRQMYQEVEDIGQVQLSSRWVLTDKSTA